MEKFYIIVDSEKPGDDSLVEGLGFLTEEEAAEFIAENQVDLVEPYTLGDGTEITKKYYVHETPASSTLIEEGAE
jgi:hypothetical protein